MKQFSIRLAVINVCPVLLPSELLLSTHLLTSEGLTAELTVGLWLVVPTTGFEPTRVGLAWFETLRLNHSATPPFTRPRVNCLLVASRLRSIQIQVRHRIRVEDAVMITYLGKTKTGSYSSSFTSSFSSSFHWSDGRFYTIKKWPLSQETRYSATPGEQRSNRKDY